MKTFGPVFSHVLCNGCAALDVGPEWILAVLALESDFNPHARNASGALGLWQKMPDVHGLPYDTNRAPAVQLGDAIQFWQNMQSAFRIGKIKSREAFYCINLAPARLRFGNYDDETVLYAAPSRAYEANARSFGLNPKNPVGVLRMKDLAVGLDAAVKRNQERYDAELEAAYVASVG